MNERIKKLAAKCWDLKLDGLHFDQEKFAELLLEDVLSICEDLGDRGIDGHYCVDAIAKKYSMNQWRVEQ
jgi:hypothetical protein